MILAYQQNPGQYLTQTACRRNLSGDVCAILRFLNLFFKIRNPFIENYLKEFIHFWNIGDLLIFMCFLI